MDKCWRWSSLLFVAVFVSKGIVVASQACPAEYQEINDKCFLVSTVDLTWDLAVHNCSANSFGQLAILLNPNVTQNLTGLMTSDDTYWIGLRESQNSPGWSWRDGQPLDYALWASGQPSNDLTTGQDCAHYWKRDGGWSWNDQPCEKKLFLVCMKTVSSSQSCPTGFSLIGDECYNASTVEASWYTARWQCRAQHAKLPVVLNWETHAAITDLLNGTRHYWIGLAETIGWSWTDGHLVVFNDWSTGEPSNDNRNGADCAHYWTPGGQWRWNDRPCSTSLYFICEKVPVSGVCTQNYRLKGEKCYNVSTVTKTWDNARDVCQAEGADLALVLDADTNTRVKGFLTSGSQYWIGLRESPSIATPGWQWIGRRLVDNSQWAAGEPSNNLPNGRDCGYVSQDTAGKWRAGACDDARRFICKTDKIASPTTTTTTMTTPTTMSTTRPVVTTTTATTPASTTPILTMTTATTPTSTTPEMTTTTTKMSTISALTMTTSTSTTPEMTMTTPTKMSTSSLMTVTTEPMTISTKMGMTTTTPVTTEPRTPVTTTPTPTIMNTTAIENASRTSPGPTSVIIDMRPVTKESIDFLRNLTSPQNNTRPPNNLCPCNCRKFVPNPPPNVLAEMLLKIQNELKVDTNKLSSKRNKKISAKDERVSSQAIAAFAAFLLALPLSLIVLADVLRLFQK